MALLAGAHWQHWRSSLPLSFCPLVASFSISPPPPHPLFRPALCANVLQNDKSSIFKFGIEALACVVATACLFLSCLRPKEIISRSPSRLCCDPRVGGGASREHRGADEALGMPAGGEEPGAAEGESRRRRPRYGIARKGKIRSPRKRRKQTVPKGLGASDLSGHRQPSSSVGALNLRLGAGLAFPGDASGT